MEDGPKRGLRWDANGASEAIAFYEEVLCLNGGQFEDKPFLLKGWQAFIVGSIFGWKIAASGLRRFRKVYVETAKGSGKSPLAAGIGIKLLCADGEARAEIYAAAVKQDQAKVLFRDAVAMVNQSPALSRKLLLTGGADPDNIGYIPAESFFRPISSERQGRGQSGPRPHCALLDEIHEHPTNAIVEFMSAGRKWRRQPLIFMITNSGSNRNSVCWEYHQYGISVGSGEREDDEFFSYICALDKDDDPFASEDCWIKANPSLPEIPGYDYIRGELRQARGMSSKENLVRRLNFCEWTDAVDAWIGKDLWKSVNAHLDLDEYAGRECYGGLDMSLSNDLTAFVLAFPTEHRKWDVFSWFWLAGDRIREIEAKANMDGRFREWRDAGYLNAPPGKTIDFEGAAELIADVCNRFQVKAIAYDRAKVEYLRGPLEAMGCQAPLIEHGQGFFKAQKTGLWMPGSIGELETAIIDGRIRINENPVLSWNVASAVTKPSRINPADKYFLKVNESVKIDGAVALAMAIGAATMAAPEAPKFQMLFV